MTLCACVCTCVCLCGCICVCMFMPGEGLWVNWCVAGMGTRGPSPLSRAGRNRGGKEGIETHHEIGAMAERNPLCPEGDLASRSGSAPSPSSDGFPDGAWRALELAAPSLSHFQQPCGLGLRGQLLRPALCPSGGCWPPAASSPGLAVTPYTPISCHKGQEELTRCKL